MTDRALTDIVASVIADWHHDDDHTAQTATRMGEIATRFARRLNHCGITTLYEVDEEACRGFIDAPTRTGAPPTVATRYFRRVTLRALFRSLRRHGIDVGDPTIDIHLPPRSERSTRALTFDEVILCRTATYATRLTHHRRAAAWALAETAASTAEIPLITGRHLDDPADPQYVYLPGSRRIDARLGELTPWGRKVMTRRLALLPDHNRSVVYGGDGGEVARQAATCNLIRLILHSAGLTDPDIRPESIRLWRARHHYRQTGDLIACARLLGNRSLDRTAEALDLEWRPR